MFDPRLFDSPVSVSPDPYSDLAGPISASLRVPPEGSLPTGKPDREPHTDLANASDPPSSWRFEKIAPRWIAGAPRAATLEEMWLRAERVLASCGITRVADLTGLDAARVPVAAAYRPNSRSLAVSQGKGTSWEACRVSAAMEGIEFDHAERIQTTLILQRANELAGAYVLDGLACRSTNAYDPSRPLLWIEGEELFTGETCWAPFAAVSLDMTLPAGYVDIGLDRGSNGLASGATKLEAVVHGVNELIERDAAALWELSNRAGVTSLDPLSIADVGALAVVETCRNAGLSVALFDVTSDLGIPCIRAEIVDTERNDFRLIAAAAGFGCHIHPGVAALRAVTEAVQTRMVFISGARDDLARRTFSSRRDPEGIQLQREAIFAAVATARPWPTTSVGARLAVSRSQESGLGKNREKSGLGTNLEESLESSSSFGLRHQLTVSLESLRHNGFSTGCIVDLSRPSAGIPVVKVLIPGLIGALSVGTSDLVLSPRALDAVQSAATPTEPLQQGVNHD